MLFLLARLLLALVLGVAAWAKLTDFKGTARSKPHSCDITVANRKSRRDSPKNIVKNVSNLTYRMPWVFLRQNIVRIVRIRSQIPVNAIPTS